MSKNDLLDNEQQEELVREKCFSGRYEYFRDGAYYAEEIFEVYSTEDKSLFWYESQYLSRIETGELLKIQVEYHTNKHWIPLSVRVEKFLGTRLAEESYEYIEKDNTLHYTFDCEEEQASGDIKVPPRFQISTPSFLSSMLFSQTMRFSTKGSDEVYVITSYNDWQFEELPKEQTLLVGQRKQSMQKIEIKGNKLPCTEYSVDKAFHSKKIRTKDRQPPAKFYLSKHIGIPYRAELGDGLIISIDILKDLNS